MLKWSLQRRFFMLGYDNFIQKGAGDMEIEIEIKNGHRLQNIKK